MEKNMRVALKQETEFRAQQTGKKSYLSVTPKLQLLTWGDCILPV
jgi:hypothetical protein